LEGVPKRKPRESGGLTQKRREVRNLTTGGGKERILRKENKKESEDRGALEDGNQSSAHFYERGGVRGRKSFRKSCNGSELRKKGPQWSLKNAKQSGNLSEASLPNLRERNTIEKDLQQLKLIC